MFLAKWAFDNEHCLYGIKPKLHFMKHLLQEVKKQIDSEQSLILNPLVFDCSQCEDVIGRVCRLGRPVDGRMLSSRVLQNYLLTAGLLAEREKPRV